MSQGRETDVLIYVATLRKEQERVILSGTFTKIEEYRAACTTVRNLDRVATCCSQIMAGREAAEVLAESGLTEMTEGEI